MPLPKVRTGTPKTKLVGVALVLVCALLTTGITYFMWGYTQELLQERLKERLVAISSTASLYFSAERMRTLRDLVELHGRETIHQDFYKQINKRLNDVRDSNESIRYVYLFGKTDDPATMLFLADADVDEELVLPEGDPGNDFPGSPYDASDVPTLVRDGFLFPVTDDELIEDEWGLTLSAYAPIFDPETKVADAIIAIDVDVTQYVQQVNATFMPFVLFIVFLLLLIASLAYSLVRMWEGRVSLFRELDRQKDELLSIVSHQLATPVSSVRWYLEMMQDGDIGNLTKEQDEHVRTMQSVVKDLIDLVGMILDVSRIQLGRMRVDRSDVDLGELFSEIFAIIEPKVQEKHLTFIKRIADTLPIASLDRRLTRMTIENLLSNAVKYTPEGGEVTLTAAVSDHTLRYEVRDTGCGIPKKDQGKIFGKLFRAGNAQKVQGNGLGLFVAKGAVEAQGGKISFVSDIGKGTTFTVSLPLLAQEERKSKS